MTGNELRKKYIDFFVSRNHKEISGQSLIPENDPTVLFTTAGMHPLVPYLQGQPHPAGKRLTNYQKCIRTGDIEAVGDPSHLTFFEMLGNWSLGDYFKEEALSMSWEFLTSKEYLGLDKERLSVTVFAGDDEVPRDNEAADIWRAQGVPESRIYFLPREDNWWGPAGNTGPCGPDSEMFYDTGKEACGDDCKPGCHCGKYFEIWNDVFMQYNKTEDGLYEKLDAPCVDTGMGIERTATMLQGKNSVYQTELFIPIIAKVEELTGKHYGDDEDVDISIRIISDHCKSATMIIGDPRGAKPSNLGQGYILRRLIRRAVRHGRKLGITENFLGQVSQVAIDMYKDVYTELADSGAMILNELELEEKQFSTTLKKGEHEFEKILPNLLKNPRKEIPGRLAFKLYDTFGFPLELTEELASEHGMTVDRDGFEAAFKKHQEASKKGADKIFKGGLADHSEMTTRYHTATHMLHEALKRVLGDHVEQKGSNITEERLRFDFSHPEKMTTQELKEVEDLVNAEIQKSQAVSMKTMTVEEAREQGARALFSSKYGEQVKVYFIGDYSIEVCGGPHIENTSELGKFVIKKEQSSSRGVRRIKAVLQ
ncbi:MULTISPECIES: alanine--tRNA ligase [unclassified Oceanispirochaeta]|uniref:alanine--tRNA ligase n=1 Tax=unclassified Oceanispirochaeta TaxID=2635722 RepID=UPI000E090EDF|nr:MULTISPECIES: alanine--tRNA ligase [unclassified Oceanispirochaeta]MBF9015734.1 alanine--tRNA ligase [Oceanispirochaeta sp. M2]NPD72199.1 alanine--tRNA ligase [Oceanispirochaeta sp. M1]RDG32298.1 alanine--tRNA ligase [Oceanispirochaeta sp. M1]